MKKAFLFLNLVVLFVPLTIPLQAKASYVNDYEVCAKYLKESPKQQKANFIPGPLSFQDLLNRCRALVRKGLKSAEAADREESAGESAGESSSPSEPTYREQCSGTPGHFGCDDRGPGSLYDQAGCEGTPGSFNCQE